MQKTSKVSESPRTSTSKVTIRKEPFPYIKLEDVGIRFKLKKRHGLRRLILGQYEREEFYALRHFNLEAKGGDVIGLLGKNGSGKTTLLRTITGIYSLDEGTIVTRGKISLMDISSSMNYDLDGISNIRLAMSLYGIQQKITEMKIKKIIEFADIGKFIREPVRKYSSGMRARLGFAIGINVDSDIILIDETFAVGDKEFIEKCMKYMRMLVKRTDKIIIMASHDELLVKQLTNKIITL